MLLLLDLNRTPVCGCADIILLPPISFSPIREVQTLYSGETVRIAIAYSVSGFTNTGEGKVNVVAVAAVEDVFTSAGSTLTRPNGSIFAPGYPLITFLISTVTGATESLSEKKRSTEVINLPSVELSP